MTTHDPTTDPDHAHDLLGRELDVVDGDESSSLLAGLGASLGHLQVPGPSPEARQRMEARFTRIVDSGAPGPLARVLAWFGFGTAEPRLAPKFAAGALFALVLGGTASTIAGVTPLEIASRLGNLARSIAVNLDPTSGEDAAVAPADTQTPTPSTDPIGTTTAPATVETAVGTATPPPVATTTEEPTAGPGLVAPPAAPTREADSESPAEPSQSELESPTATQEPPATATSTPTVRPTATRPPATATSDPTATPPTPEATSTPAPPTPTSTATPVPSPDTTVYPAGSAGSVTVRRDGDDLTVIAVNPASKWTYEIEVSSGHEVEVVFDKDGTEVRFRAQVNGDTVDVTVSEQSTSSGQG